MVLLKMEDVVEGYQLFLDGNINIDAFSGNTVFASTGKGENRYQISIKDINKPFHRFICTCNNCIEEHSFCIHLIALIYLLQQNLPGYIKLFNHPESENILTELAEKFLFEV